MITVSQTGAGDPMRFDVTVSEGNSSTSHKVTMGRELYKKLTGGETTPEGTIQAAFRFLLDREPKESIMGSFDVTVISRYFPSFETEVKRYLI